MNTDTLYCRWKHRETRIPIVIGKLTFDGEFYKYCYTQGVRNAFTQDPLFDLIKEFPQTDNLYIKNTMFHFFLYRIRQRKGKGYYKYLKQLGLKPDENSHMNLLRASKGVPWNAFQTGFNSNFDIVYVEPEEAELDSKYLPYSNDLRSVLFQ